MPTEEQFNRKKVFWKYTFYITMSILAVTNTAFLICNWQDLKPNLNQESLLLSVVGFFFAFAGINIYSIFNTNIENEKAALQELKRKYDGELKLSSEMLQFPQELIMIWHTSQYIAMANVMQGKSFDWLRDLKKRMKRQRDFVQDLRDHYRTEVHNRYRDDLSNLAKGVLMVLKQHQASINSHDAFFSPLPSNKDNYNSVLNDVISFLDETVTFEYEPEIPPVELSFWAKAKQLYRFARKTFGKK